MRAGSGGALHGENEKREREEETRRICLDRSLIYAFASYFRSGLREESGRNICPVVGGARRFQPEPSFIISETL